jgi:hypothetical protein
MPKFSLSCLANFDEPARPAPASRSNAPAGIATSADSDAAAASQGAVHLALLARRMRIIRLHAISAAAG